MRPNDVRTTSKAIIKVLARRYVADHLHKQSRSQGLASGFLVSGAIGALRQKHGGPRLDCFSLLYFQLVIRNVVDFMSHFRYSGWFAFSFEPYATYG